MRLPCDAECARSNWCDLTNTEVECARCGATVLRCEVDDWGCCADCAEEAEREREEEEAEVKKQDIPKTGDEWMNFPPLEIADREYFERFLDAGKKIMIHEQLADAAEEGGNA